MSDVLALEPSPLPDVEAVKQERKTGFGAMFKAVLESLVAAQRSRFNDSEPLLYRFPPL
jgi:hypothetical protein